jgi:hypothetical protein
LVLMEAGEMKAVFFGFSMALILFQVTDVHARLLRPSAQSGVPKNEEAGHVISAMFADEDVRAVQIEEDLDTKGTVSLTPLFVENLEKSVAVVPVRVVYSGYSESDLPTIVAKAIRGMKEVKLVVAREPSGKQTIVNMGDVPFEAHCFVNTIDVLEGRVNPTKYLEKCNNPTVVISLK